MPAFIPSLGGARPHLRSGLLALAAAALAALLWARGPIGQWAHYHRFADARSWLGVPNAADVLSNLPFLAIGAWALWRLRRAPSASPTLTAWRAFAVALVLTAIGSAVYHWSPGNDSLVGDRLPIAWACAALACAFLGERVGTQWSRPEVLAGALSFAALAVAFWWLTERAGEGDLRLYLFVQVLPMLLVPLGLVLGLAATTPAATPARAWWAVLGCYVLAKGFEIADQAVFAALGALSGHTLKHLVAAAGAGLLLRAAVQAQTGRVSSGSRR